MAEAGGDRPAGSGDDAVLAGLARLGAALAVDPAPDELLTTVMARVESMETPAASGFAVGAARIADLLRRHWRRATAVAVALLIGLLAVTPAGARIAEWLGIGGVQIVQEPSGSGPPASGPPDPASADGFTELTLDEARTRVAFPIAVPAELGPPSRVLVGPGDRVVSMVWTDGDPASPGSAVRLDQLTGQPDYAAVKKYFGDVEFLTVDGHDAFWLRAPHPLVYVDPAGGEHTERLRIAGPTLIWQSGPVTLRLEGIATQQRALEIARSVG